MNLDWQWVTNPDFTLRAGVSRGDLPIPDSKVLLNILAPAVIETHLNDHEASVGIKF